MDGTLHRSAAATAPPPGGRLLRFDRRLRGGDALAARTSGEVSRLRDRLLRRRADARAGRGFVAAVRSILAVRPAWRVSAPARLHCRPPVDRWTIRPDREL